MKELINNCIEVWYIFPSKCFQWSVKNMISHLCYIYPGRSLLKSYSTNFYRHYKLNIYINEFLEVIIYAYY